MEEIISNELLRLAIENTTEGVTIADLSKEDCPLIFVNKGFETVTGYKCEEVMGKNCRFLQGKDTNPESVKKIREAIQNFEPCHVELLNYTKDNKPFWNLLNIAPIQTANGKPKYMVGIQNDITQIKQAEFRLSTYQSKLEKILQVKDSLISVVAHDFRSSIGTIFSFSELLFKEINPNLNPELKNYAHNVLSSSELALNTLQDLLELYTSELVGNSQRVDIGLADATEKILMGFQDKIKNKHIEFKIDIKKEVQLLVNPDLTTILRNIISNAIKFVPKNGQVTARYEEHEASHLIEIIDNGVGMPEEKRKFLYGEKTSLSDSSWGTFGEEGTGLGSLIVSRLIAKNKWSIRVDSQEGQGSSVKLMIPKTG